MYKRQVLGRTWKGNARQLRSYIEQAVVLSDQGIVDLPLEDRNLSANEPSRASSDEFVPLQAMIEETERQHIQRALARTDGSVSKTAELLGISRKTLWEKLKRLKMRTVEAELSQAKEER